MAAKRNAQLPLVPEAPPEQESIDLLVDEVLAGVKLVGPPPDHSFVQSVRKWGILTPIAVKRQARGGVKLVDGFRRLRAVVILRDGEVPEDWPGAPEAWVEQWNTIPARVVKTNGWHPEVMPVVLNHQRSENFAVTLASIEELVKEGHTEKDIYNATGVPIATIRRLMHLVNLEASLKKAFMEGKIVANVAIAAAKCTPEQQAELAKVYRGEEQLTASDVREVKRSGQRAAQQALAGMDVEDDLGDVWRDEVVRKLRECLELVPADQTDLREDLTLLIDAVDLVTEPPEADAADEPVVAGATEEVVE